MKFIRNFSTLIARFFLSAFFLASAVNKILHWHETEKELANVFCEWQSYVGLSESMQDCFALAVPWVPLVLIVATLCELIGGLLVLLGIHEKWGASLLILFLIPATVLLHPFWFAEADARELQTAMFLKNLAMIGGFILLLLHGAKTKSGGDSFSSFKIT